MCSTTLWVGQVDKKATQQDLTNLFEEFGQIESINVSRPLPPLPSNLVAVCSFDLLKKNVMTVPKPVITVAVPNDLSCVLFFFFSFLLNSCLTIFLSPCPRVSLQMIPPRGCAYICMVHRQDAYRARQKLSTGTFKIGSKIIKVHITYTVYSIVFFGCSKQ